ncbi:MAG: alpha-N-arabinofuranosidase, partial [Schaedlerella arabinosiphila]|nr:alpha-N-arabinofuranosidase [Schaedlerella arabinosiphila]
PVHETSRHGAVTDVVSVAVFREEEEELTVFAVNRNLEEDQQIHMDLRSFEGYGILEKIELVSEDLKAENSIYEENVKPVRDKEVRMDGQMVELVLKKASWNVIRFGKK